jgi:GMP synthase PP-ATPase subunit
MKFLAHIATRIVNEVKGVNRVVSPGTIERE